MRISTLMSADNARTALNQAVERVIRAEERVASGRRLNRPSDDPAGLTQALSLRSSLEGIAQFRRNAADAKGFLGTTDTALANASDLLRQARTLAVQGANDTLEPEARQALARQVDAIIERIGAIGNTAYGSRYVFGGQRTTEPPFVQVAGAWTYHGGASADGESRLTVEIGVGDELAMNVAGEAVFPRAFQALATVRDQLASGSKTALSKEGLQAVDAALRLVGEARADVGSRMQRLLQADATLEEAQGQLATILSGIEDADIPSTVVELKSAETAYQSALAATAHGFRQSLLDFLR